MTAKQLPLVLVTAVLATGMASSAFAGIAVGIGGYGGPAVYVGGTVDDDDYYYGPDYYPYGSTYYGTVGYGGYYGDHYYNHGYYGHHGYHNGYGGYHGGHGGHHH